MEWRFIFDRKQHGIHWHQKEMQTCLNFLYFGKGLSTEYGNLKVI